MSAAPLTTTGSFTWQGGYLKQNYYMLGIDPNLKACCNLIKKYFDITNNDLRMFINSTRSFERVENRTMPIVFIESLLLDTQTGSKTIENILDKINERLGEEKLACRIKFHHDVPQHMILENNYIDSQFDNTIEHQEITLKEINQIPVITSIQDVKY